MEMNFMAILVAAVTTLVVGLFWYSDMAFGKVWRQETGISKDDERKGNMLKTFGITLICSLLLSFFMQVLVIHQFGALGMVGGDATKALPSYAAFMADYGGAFRTFRHGALHGFMSGIFLVLPLNIINGLFEYKSWKYIAIRAGYWIVTLTIMGAIVCGWT